MNYYSFPNNKEKKDEYSNDEESNDSENESNYESSEIDEETDILHCKNIDPRLAKLMGLLIEEQLEVIDWKPPTKSGLDNSEVIFSYNHLNSKYRENFNEIKEDILHHRTLTEKQLEHIKTLNNEEKFELIKIYNKLLEQPFTNIKK